MTLTISVILFATALLLPTSADEPQGRIFDEYYDYVEYADPDIYWRSETAVVCTECPRRVRPPTRCNKCSSEFDCGIDETCCPFLTMRTTLGSCTREQHTNCKLSNTITLDFIKRVCSCVRQVKCCVKSRSAVTNNNVTTTAAATATSVTTTVPKTTTLSTRQTTAPTTMASSTKSAPDESGLPPGVTKN